MYTINENLFENDIQLVCKLPILRQSSMIIETSGLLFTLYLFLIYLFLIIKTGLPRCKLKVVLKHQHFVA